MEKRIERYLAGEMEAAEKSAFEREIAEDSILQKEVASYKNTIKAIRLEGRTKLKNRFANLDEGQPNTDDDKEKAGPSRRKPTLFITLFLIAMIFWFTQRNKETAPGINPNEELNTETAIDVKPEKEETLPEKTITPASNETTPVPEENKPTNQPTKTKRPIAKTEPSIQNNQALFAQNFGAYHHPSMRPNVRGQGDLSPREQFELAYWEKDFPKVLTLWNSLSDTQKNNGNLLFLKAVALMTQDEIGDAKQDFEQLINLKRHRFVEPSEWYLALAILYQEDTTKAKTSLTSIAENTSHQFNQSAIDLLQILD